MPPMKVILDLLQLVIREVNRVLEGDRGKGDRILDVIPDIL